MGTKFPSFNFPVCKIYLDTWARRVRRARRARKARRARGHVGHAIQADSLITDLFRREHKGNIEKKCVKHYYLQKLTFSKLQFQSVKHSSPNEFLGSSNSRRYH